MHTAKTRHQKRHAETGGWNGASIAKFRTHGDQLISAKPRSTARFESKRAQPLQGTFRCVSGKPDRVAIRGRIEHDMRPQLRHLDLRADDLVARRATTIAALARVISERDVSKGLRRTLVTQARRLQRLAATRFEEIGGGIPLATPDEQQ